MEQTDLRLACYVLKVTPEAFVSLTQATGNFTGRCIRFDKPDERIELPMDGDIESSYDPFHNVFIMRIPAPGLTEDVDVAWEVTTHQVENAGLYFPDSIRRIRQTIATDPLIT